MPCKSTDPWARAGRCSIERRRWDPGGIATCERRVTLSLASTAPFASDDKVVTPSGLPDHQQIQAFRPSPTSLQKSRTVCHER